eukprot:CAMPEP_0196597634 /NCGR_PEP_ID=MMETSP1081-20130531/92308_1 /TAXON_ID=36882 /ORGANISM="Pyramimonas amylifera, Strain CCMP720" /LENGTH=47 /DNA_ID= /DNA_START= /DNA_END= /DNA_ORIENTATION=
MFTITHGRKSRHGRARQLLTKEGNSSRAAEATIDPASAAVNGTSSDL